MASIQMLKKAEKIKNSGPSGKQQILSAKAGIWGASASGFLALFAILLQFYIMSQHTKIEDMDKLLTSQTNLLKGQRETIARLNSVVEKNTEAIEKLSGILNESKAINEGVGQELAMSRSSYGALSKQLDILAYNKKGEIRGHYFQLRAIVSQMPWSAPEYVYIDLPWKTEKLWHERALKIDTLLDEGGSSAYLVEDTFALRKWKNLTFYDHKLLRIIERLNDQRITMARAQRESWLKDRKEAAQCFYYWLNDVRSYFLQTLSAKFEKE